MNIKDDGQQSVEIEIEGITFCYQVRGQGPAAVLLHGFTGCGANWFEIVDKLADDYRVVTIDLLGHGKSSAPVDAGWYAMETAGRHLRTLIEAQVGEAVHLLGYSMGGRLALYCALQFPDLVRSLTLESASPGLESESERQQRRAADERLAFRIEDEGLLAFVKYWEALPLFSSQQRLPDMVRRRLHEQRLANRVDGLAGSLRGLGTGAQPNLWGRLGELDKPVLLITGELDEKFTQINQRMLNLLPAARLEVVSGAGHTVHLEAKHVFIELVRKFWKGSKA